MVAVVGDPRLGNSVLCSYDGLLGNRVVCRFVVTSLLERRLNWRFYADPPTHEFTRLVCWRLVWRLRYSAVAIGIFICGSSTNQNADTPKPSLSPKRSPNRSRCYLSDFRVYQEIVVRQLRRSINSSQSWPQEAGCSWREYCRFAGSTSTRSGSCRLGSEAVRPLAQ